MSASPRRPPKARSITLRPSSAPSVAEAAAMLKEAQSRGCQTGIAFHVGSQCLTPERLYDRAEDGRRGARPGQGANRRPRCRRRLSGRLSRHQHAAAGRLRRRDRGGREEARPAPRLRVDVRARPRLVAAVRSRSSPRCSCARATSSISTTASMARSGKRSMPACSCRRACVRRSARSPRTGA